MARILLHLLLLALPFVLWFAYMKARGRAAAEGRVWSDAPILGLLLGGIALSALALFGLGAFESGAPGSTYVPAYTNEEGEIVPGRFE